MDFRQAILDIPKALTETLNRAKPEYEALARETRWGEVPVYLVATGPVLHTALYGGYAFETLLGWPTVVRDALEFVTYGTGVLRQRSVVLLLSNLGEEQDLFAAAQAARARGGVVLAMTANPYSALAKAAQGVFLIRAGEDCQPPIKSTVCLQVGLAYLGLTLARLLKRPQATFAALEEELWRLPDLAEQVLTQLLDAVRSFAAELKNCRKLWVCGEGFYRPTARYWSWLLRQATSLPALCYEDRPDQGAPRRADEAVVFLSGSRCRLKKQIHEQASRAKHQGARILAVTDANDRELTNRADLAVLLPTLHEITGSLLDMALLGWATYHATRDSAMRQSGSSGRKPK